MQAKGFAHFGLLVSLSIYTGFSHAMPISDLLISEVMVNPAALSDARGEWFELLNPTTEEINLREITIGDDGRDRHRIESDLLILPGEYLTLARYFDPGFIPDYVYDDFILSNSEDEIVFNAGTSELLRFEYGSDFDAAGRSRELGVLPMIASHYDLTPASFGHGYGDIGTPGDSGSFRVSVAAVPLPDTAWLFIGGTLMLLTTTALLRRRKSSPHRSCQPSGPGRHTGSLRRHSDTSDRRESQGISLPRDMAEHNLGQEVR